MIFVRQTHEAVKQANTKEKVIWETKFAFFPKKIAEKDGLSLYVWFQFYELRLYWGGGPGPECYFDYRLPGASQTWTERTYLYSREWTDYIF